MEETTKQLLTTIAENQPKIKELGYNEGFGAGYKEYNRAFWERYQQGGKRTDYSRAFTYGENANYPVFNKETFAPIYDIFPTNANRMFKNGLEGIEDLVEHLENLGVTLDFGNCKEFNQAFSHMGKSSAIDVKRIGIIDVSSATTSISNTFASSSIETIDKIICLETTKFSNTFLNATRLANITFEGVIGSSISFSSSPLTVASLKSIITHLKDYSGTESENTYTVTFKASAFAALEAEGSTSPNGNTWTEYIDDLKWNLELA